MDKKYKLGSPIPKSIGLTADMYKEVRDLRLAMAKEVAAVETREKELRQHIIDNLSKSDDTGAAGKKYRAQITRKKIPTAEDWDKIRAYIRENDAFELLEKRLSSKAIAELWEDGNEVPGIGRFNKIDVSITKI